MNRYAPSLAMLMMVWGGLAAGCAGAPVDRSTEPLYAQARQLMTVPFYPDDTDQCGPAALASVLTFWGLRIHPQYLRDEVYVRELRGSLAMDLQEAARLRGFQADARPSDIGGIKTELEAGHPVVALLNLGLPFLPIGHYVVITGYDDRRGGFYAHSGLQRHAFFSYGRFTRQWQKAGRWMLIVLPADLDARDVT